MMSTPDPSSPLGLIAGEGELPFVIARNARRAGRRVVTVALRGSADPQLRAVSDAFCWRGVARLGSWIRWLRRWGCREVVMVGRVRKGTMFERARWLQWLQYLPDLTTIRLWYRTTRDKRDHTLLAAVADVLHERGLELIDSTRYCRDVLAAEGLLTPDGPQPLSRAPHRVLDDAAFGWPIARQVAALDIGQAIAVKEREVIAVEAIEGTDALIERAGRLCRTGGWTLIKLARPDQDMRFDVPTVGPTTIEKLYAAGAAGLVVEAHRTIMLRPQQMLKLAQKCRIAVLGLRDAPSGGTPAA